MFLQTNIALALLSQFFTYILLQIYLNNTDLLLYILHKFKIFSIIKYCIIYVSII